MFGNGYKRILIIICIVSAYLYAAAIVSLTVGSVVSYSDHMTVEKKASLAVFDDALSHYAYFKAEDVKLTEDNSVLIDNKTATRILNAVALYNKEVEEMTTISYTYKTFKGKITSFDDITGEVTVEPIIVEHTKVVEKPVYRKVAVSKGEYDKLPDVLKAGSSGFTYYRRVYVGTEMVEEIETERIEPEITSHTEDISINRKSVDSDSKGFGEDIFYLKWQPVYCLCSMLIQAKLDDIGTYGEIDPDGESILLSNEDIQNIIDIFSYKYSFYDDCTLYDATSLSFEHILNESAGYRLDATDITKDGSGAEEITVKRIPSIAPQMIYNCYISYDYIYTVLPNGYYGLTERTCVCEPDNFLTACEELIPDFDAELFVELLRNMPDCGDLVNHFDALIHSKTAIRYTNSADECPAIGTTVSTPKGFLAKLFHRTGASDALSGVVGGTTSGVISTIPSAGADYDPGEALSDELFSRMYDTAIKCIGTKYVFGGNGGPGVSFDCSSFVSYVIRECGYPIGRYTTIGLLDYTVPIDTEDAKPGDIIFFQGTYRAGVSHVGIWLGDNKFIHASSGAKQVTISEYKEGGYYDKHFLSFGKLP